MFWLINSLCILSLFFSADLLAEHPFLLHDVIYTSIYFEVCSNVFDCGVKHIRWRVLACVHVCVDTRRLDTGGLPKTKVLSFCSCCVIDPLSFRDHNPPTPTSTHTLNHPLLLIVSHTRNIAAEKTIQTGDKREPRQLPSDDRRAGQGVLQPTACSSQVCKWFERCRGHDHLSPPASPRLRLNLFKRGTCFRTCITVAAVNGSIPPNPTCL